MDVTRDRHTQIYKNTEIIIKLKLSGRDESGLGRDE